MKAICDFTHGHIRFDYNSARATRSAHDAFRKGSVCAATMAHLALTLCRCLNIPARYCTGYLGEIGVPPDRTPAISAAGSSPSSVGAGGHSMPAQQAASAGS